MVLEAENLCFYHLKIDKNMFVFYLNSDLLNL